MQIQKDKSSSSLHVWIPSISTRCAESYSHGGEGRRRRGGGGGGAMEAELLSLPCLGWVRTGEDDTTWAGLGWALLPFCFGLYFALLSFFSSFPLLLESTRLSTELFNPKPNQHASNQRTLATERFASRKKTREAHLN